MYQVLTFCIWLNFSHSKSDWFYYITSILDLQRNILCFPKLQLSLLQILLWICLLDVVSTLGGKMLLWEDNSNFGGFNCSAYKKNMYLCKACNSYMTSCPI